MVVGSVYPSVPIQMQVQWDQQAPVLELSVGSWWSRVAVLALVVMGVKGGNGINNSNEKWV